MLSDDRIPRHLYHHPSPITQHFGRVPRYTNPRRIPARRPVNQDRPVTPDGPPEGLKPSVIERSMTYGTNDNDFGELHHA